MPEFNLNIPNFSESVGKAPSNEIIQGLIQKKQAENELNFRQHQLNNQSLIQAAQTGANLVSTAVQAAQMRQRRQFAQDIAASMAITPNTSPATINMGNGLQSVPTASYNPTLNDQLMSAAQANPEGFVNRYIETALNKPSQPAFQPKTVMVDNIPKEAGYDPHQNQFYDVNTKQPLNNVQPYSPTMQTELTDADRKRLAPIARVVANAEALPQAFVNARGNEKEKVSLLALEMNPNFDPTQIAQRVGIRKDYSPGGKVGGPIMSQNVAINHLDRLAKNGAALNQDQIQLWNKFKNTAKRATGDATVDRMLADRDAITSELSRVYQGIGVVPQSERDELRRRISEASSPEQIQAVGDEWIKLLSGRVKTTKESWQQTMGDIKEPTPFLTSQSKKILKEHGYDPETLDQVERPSSQSNSQNIDLGNGFSYKVK